VTGILHEPGNVPEIVRDMLRLAEDEPLRLKMGAAARARAIEDFSEERLTAAFQDFYRKQGVLG
jgi:glycosyltransferase involved in cell wall biosynthesis